MLVEVAVGGRKRREGKASSQAEAAKVVGDAERADHKEVVAKAFGCGFSEAFSFLDIEIISDSTGKRRQTWVRLSLKAKNATAPPLLPRYPQSIEALRDGFCRRALTIGSVIFFSIKIRQIN